MKNREFFVSLGALFVAAACSSSSGGGDSSHQMATGGSGAFTTGGTGGVSGGGGIGTGAAGSGTGAAGSGTGGSDAMAERLTRACEDSCAVAESCIETVPDCVANCLLGTNLFDATCQELILAEAECQATLECDELIAYTNQRRGDPNCGAQFDALFEQCTVTGGEVPTECTSFCGALQECGIDGVAGQGACEENCVTYLTGIDIAAGSAACVATWQEAYGCMGATDCTQLAAVLSSGTTPSECAYLDDEILDVCY